MFKGIRRRAEGATARASLTPGYTCLSDDHQRAGHPPDLETPSEAYQPSMDGQSSLAQEGEPLSQTYARGIAYGCINGILVTPVLVSFAAIIFRDSAFHEYMPRLVKLVIFSGTVHQLCFTMRSTLPFAVGSVQDAGLIFLSAIASSTVAYTGKRGYDENCMISTVSFVLCICTAMLGAALVLTGKLRLASLVQYLPMPVVGGYLAYIGFFCGEAGLGLMAGLQLNHITDWGQFRDPWALALIAPGVCCGIGLYMALRNIRSVFTLPLCMGVIIGGFFLVLAATGTSLQEARNLGWVTEAAPQLPITQAWAYFDIEQVAWGALPRALLSWFAMFLVVAFSSSLDVAAIEMEMGTPLDYNSELQTVGWSNLVAGLAGGFTGSYIFSQTIFNLRAGVKTRVAGLAAVSVQLGIVALPFSIMSYVPKLFFGSLLVLISVDLMTEWLWEARHRMMRMEYVVCLLTFVAMQTWGVELGIGAGVTLAVMSFTFSYARLASVMTARVKDSTVMRTFEERRILKAQQRQVLVLALQGYIFFGSAVTILRDVKAQVVWEGDDGEEDPPAPDPPDLGDPGAPATMSPLRLGGGAATEFSPRSVPIPSDGTPSERSSLFGRGSGAFLIPPSPAMGPQGELNGQPKGGLAALLGGLTRRSVDEGRPRSRHGSVNGTRTPPLSAVAGPLKYGSFLSSPAGPTGARGEVSQSLPEGGNWMRMRGQKAGGSAGYPPAPPSLPQVQELSPQADMQSRVHAYMQVWAGAPNSATPTIGPKREPGTGGPTKASEGLPEAILKAKGSNRTRWLVLDFSKVLGVDATAARVCFLMLKQLLRISGVTLVFCGITPGILRLLQAHRVVVPGDLVFERLDEALEWCEEKLLDRASHLLSRQRSAQESAGAGGWGPRQSASSHQRPSKLRTEGWHRRNASGSPNRPGSPLSDTDVEEGDGLIGRQAYYAKARHLRLAESCLEQPASPLSVPHAGPSPMLQAALGTAPPWHSHKEQDRAARVESSAEGVGTLRSMLEDYLELDTYKMSKQVSAVLDAASQFFREEVFEAGMVLFQAWEASNDLYFIGSGCVELRIQGPSGPQRLLKVSAGGSFGELGFFLKRPQAFSAVALIRCHLHMLDRAAMARMQVENPALCVLVQKAILKSVCLAASFSIEAQHYGPI